MVSKSRSTNYTPSQLFGYASIVIHLQYIPRNMHTVFALLCFVVVIHWLIFPYPPGLLRWHCGNLTIAPVPAKQPWWIWINTSCEITLNDYITTTKQSTTKTVCIFIGIYCISSTLPEAKALLWLQAKSDISVLLKYNRLRHISFRVAKFTHVWYMGNN